MKLIKGTYRRSTKSPQTLLYAAATTVLLMYAWVAFASPPTTAAIAVMILTAGILTLCVELKVESATENQGEKVSGLQQRVNDARTALYERPSGLYPYWYLISRLRQECARCLRYDLSLAVIVVRFGLDDSDDDEAYHQATTAARTTAQAIRNVDISAQIDATEFGLLLVHCDEIGVWSAMQRLEEELKDFHVQLGHSVFPGDATEPGELVSLAQSRAGGHVEQSSEPIIESDAKFSGDTNDDLVEYLQGLLFEPET